MGGVSDGLSGVDSPFLYQMFNVAFKFVLGVTCGDVVNFVAVKMLYITVAPLHGGTICCCEWIGLVELLHILMMEKVNDEMALEVSYLRDSRNHSTLCPNIECIVYMQNKSVSFFFT